MTDTATMNPVLRGFWASPSRGKVLYGGRASSKSWDAAANAIRISDAVGVKVLCTRMFQNKIAESVYSLLKAQAYRFDRGQNYEFQRDKIKHKTNGSEFLFYGLARNVDEIKSLEGVDILWIEEAHALTEEMWEILEPTIRKEHSEIWIIFNPRLATDFAYRRFVLDPPEGFVVRKINYTENPFLSQTMLDTIDSFKRKNPDRFPHVYLGEPDTDDDLAIIKRSWLESCVDAHIKLGIPVEGKKRIGFDIADDGGDLNATVAAHGILCHAVDKWKGLEDKLLQSCSKVYRLARELGSEIDYDSIGVGASAGSHFSALNEAEDAEVVYRKFNAGGRVVNPDKEYQPGVLNKDHFENIKAQAWFGVSDRIRRTHMAVTEGHEIDPSEVIAISSECDHLEALMTELSTPHKDYSPSGKSKVESKKDLAKRDVKSPNMADAFIMAYSPIEILPSNFGIMIKSKYRKAS